MSTKETIQILEDRIADLQQQLAENPTYKELEILKGTLRQLSELAAPQPTGVRLYVSDRLAPAKDQITTKGAIHAVLHEAAEPLTTREIHDRLIEAGRQVGGRDPIINLSSIMSKDNSLRSVTWRGAKRWWPANKTLPTADLLGSGEADGGTSAPKH